MIAYLHGFHPLPLCRHRWPLMDYDGCRLATVCGCRLPERFPMTCAKDAVAKAELQQRLFAKIKMNDISCWLWQGHKTDGYGRIGSNGKTVRTHRAAYQAWIGPIPDGLTLDHLCRNRECFNPVHLQPVTKKENVLRGIGVTAANARKTHCLRGHLLAGINLFQTADRRCARCEHIRQRGHDKLRQESWPDFGMRCKQGHLYDDVGVYETADGKHRCSECRKASERKRYAAARRGKKKGKR